MTYSNYAFLSKNDMEESVKNMSQVINALEGAKLHRKMTQTNLLQYNTVCDNNLYAGD